MFRYSVFFYIYIYIYIVGTSAPPIISIPKRTEQICRLYPVRHVDAQGGAPSFFVLSWRMCFLWFLRSQFDDLFYFWDIWRSHLIWGADTVTVILILFKLCEFTGLFECLLLCICDGLWLCSCWKIGSSRRGLVQGTNIIGMGKVLSLGPQVFFQTMKHPVQQVVNCYCFVC